MLFNLQFVSLGILSLHLRCKNIPLGKSAEGRFTDCGKSGTQSKLAKSFNAKYNQHNFSIMTSAYNVAQDFEDCDGFPLKYGRKWLVRYKKVKEYRAPGYVPGYQAKPAISSRLGYMEKRIDASCIRAKALRDLKLQGIDVSCSDLLTTVKELAGKYIDAVMIKFVEDLLVCSYLLMRSRSKMDTVMALTTFCKFRVKGALVTTVASELIDAVQDITSSFEVQSLEDEVGSFRSLLDNWEAVKESSLGKKYWKLILHLVRFGWFQTLNVPNTTQNHKALGGCVDPIMEDVDFVYSLVDTISLTLQRILMWKRVGRWEVLLHGETSYQKWFDKCLELKRHSLMIGNFEALKDAEGKQITTYPKFLNDIQKAVEDGERIVKFTKDNGVNLRSARMMLNDMKILDLNVLCRQAAREERQAPFALLVFGGSCVAKSTFTKLLFNAFGQYRGLPTDNEYLYTRDSKQEYWTGFETYMWGIRLDDVAYLQPGREMDKTMDEMLQLNNNVPFLANQASLEDKKRTPVRPELLIATTNNKSLSATDYFYCPLAIMRRLPWVITLVPKPEFESADRPGMVDSKLLAEHDDGDSWPNYWLIRLEYVAPQSGSISNGRVTGKHVLYKEYDDIEEFMDWFKEEVLTFTRSQQAALLCDKSMKNVKICKDCNRSGSRCVCAELQAEGYESYLKVEMGAEYAIKLDTDGEVIEYCQRSPSGEYVMLDPMDASGDFCTRAEYARDMTVRKKVIVYEGHVVSRSVARQQELNRCLTDDSEDEEMRELLKEILRKSVQREKTFFSRLYMTIVSFFVRWYFKKGSLLQILLNSCLIIGPLRRVFLRTLCSVIEARYGPKKAMKYVGKIVTDMSMWGHWRSVFKGLTLLLGAYAGYKIVKKLAKPKLEEEEVFEQADAVPDSYFSKSEKENVWKKTDIAVTAFDLDPMSLNWATLKPQQVIDTIRKNVWRTDIHGEKGIRANAFCVGGHLYVMNNHCMPKGDKIVKMYQTPPGQGVCGAVEFALEESSVLRDAEHDLVWFQCTARPPSKDLTHLIAKTPNLDGVYRGMQVGWEKDGSVRNNPIQAICRGMLWCEELQRNLDYWMGRPKQITVLGDCGMPLVVLGQHVTIVGIHQLGNDAMAGALSINQDMVNAAIKHFGTPLIQGGVPVLQAIGAEKKELGEIPPWSPLCWIKQGSLDVYGHLSGFRSVPRSKVQDTILRPACEKRGWKCEFVAPKFGWKPVQHMYHDILGMKNLLKASVLEKAVDGYSEDLIAGLPQSAFDSMRKISWEAALNGIEGVTHIDKMNFASSMGFPWNKSKKFFLQDGPDGKKVLPEHVMERAREIERRYQSGVCVNPIFAGQQKDEPRKQKKVDAGMIRMFMGGPVDWALVVRRYLLSLVKVFEENQTTTEAAVGCVAQSLEWEKFREYLVQFGEDSMIAGDYGKFDKRMSAQIILAAFEVLIRLLRRAGWDETDLLVVRCIGEDTAYPTVTVNSDLVRFHGSNPSGHVLTVIINCIANSLYQRYCFCELNPKHECSSFRDSVALLTYGDDNVMGVDKWLAPFFNHTAIQQVLETIGVEYTMADKESESRPYISIDEVSFLKRTWRFDEDVDAFLAPLEEASIHKMLMVGMSEKDKSSEYYAIEKMNNAVNEWFFYGKVRFSEERDFLLQLVHELHLEAEYELLPFPTWEKLQKRFESASVGVDLMRQREVTILPVD